MPSNHAAGHRIYPVGRILGRSSDRNGNRQYRETVHALLQVQRQWLIKGQRDDGTRALENLDVQPIQPELSSRLLELAGLLYSRSTDGSSILAPGSEAEPPGRGHRPSIWQGLGSTEHRPDRRSAPDRFSSGSPGNLVSFKVR